MATPAWWGDAASVIAWSRWGPWLVAKDSWLHLCLVQWGQCFLTQHPALMPVSCPYTPDKRDAWLFWKLLGCRHPWLETCARFFKQSQTGVWLPPSDWKIPMTCRSLKWWVFFLFTRVLAVGAGDCCACREPRQLLRAPWWWMKAYEMLLGGSGCKIWTQMRPTKAFLIKGFDNSCLLEV